MMKPLVSVIVVNYNGKRYLAECFDSLSAGLFKDFEIVFVDNGSADGSLEFVREDYPGVKALDMGENAGLARASNRGAALASGKYLFFYNNDTRADSHLLAELVRTAEADPGVGIAGCTTMTYDGGAVINSGVACDRFGYPYGEGEPLYVDAAIFIRRTVFDEIGGFDPELFLYGEDRDICWRTFLYGYKVVVVPAAVFFHDSFCSLTDDTLTTSVWKRQVGERNLIRSMLKNYGLWTLLRILPVYAALSAAEVGLFLATGKFRVVFGAYGGAWWWNAKNLPGTIRLRRKVQRERRCGDSVVLKRMGRKIGKLELFKKVGIPRFASQR
ncbi:MAG: glycosyltransferase family 2 protein [Thermodesulfobacteriota bacterium]